MKLVSCLPVQDRLLWSVRICCREVVYLMSGSCVSAVGELCICCRGVVYLLSGCCVSAVRELCICCQGVVFLL